MNPARPFTRTRLGLELFEDRVVLNNPAGNDDPGLFGESDPGKEDPDAGEPRFEFVLGDVPGTVRYDVDTTGVGYEGSYTSLLLGLRVEFGGQSFVPGDPGFLIFGDPYAVFEDGEFRYVSFDVRFAEPVAGFAGLVAGLSEAGGTEMTGYYADAEQPPAKAPVQEKGPAEINIDFATMRFRMGGMNWTVGVRVDGVLLPPAPAFNIPGPATPAVVREAMYSVLEDLGMVVTRQGETVLKVTAPQGKRFDKLYIIHNAPPLMGVEIQGPTFIPLKRGGLVEPQWQFNRNSPWPP